MCLAMLAHCEGADGPLSTKAIDDAISHKDYAVFEAALYHSNWELGVYAINSLNKVPLEVRKPLLMAALLESHIWAEPKKVKRVPYAYGSDVVRGLAQQTMCIRLSADFGLEVNYPNDWSAEERFALAKRIRDHVTASTPPEDLPEWAKTPLPTAAALAAGTQPPSKSPAISEPKPKDAESNIRSPLRWLLVTAAILLSGAWILRRSRQKRT